MKGIISNTGPLIALGSIGRIDILRHLFENVIVPEAVDGEMKAGGTHFTGLADYQRCTWIQVQALEDPLDPLLTNTLDIGEASVIYLARRLQVNLVLMDEKKGRKIARDIYNLQTIGTMRILLEGKRSGLITSVRASINEIKASGYWFHDHIVQRTLIEAGERD